MRSVEHAVTGSGMTTALTATAVNYIVKRVSGGKGAQPATKGESFQKGANVR